jgi:hypothetical protein
MQKPYAHQANSNIKPPEIWTLTLNRYQRDNLLFLLNRVGYPYDNFWRENDLGDLAWSEASKDSLKGDGDWLGEIVQMLAKTEEWKDGKPIVSMVIDKNDSPNGLDWREYGSK